MSDKKDDTPGGPDKFLKEMNKYLNKSDDAKKKERFEAVFNEIVLRYISIHDRKPGVIRIARDSWRCLTRMKKSKKLEHAGIPIVLDGDLHPGMAVCGELH